MSDLKKYLMREQQGCCQGQREYFGALNFDAMNNCSNHSNAVMKLEKGLMIASECLYFRKIIRQQLFAVFKALFFPCLLFHSAA